ncbi:MAG TPA: hypothetical protein VFC39_16255 [Acidobacteriaceae bacterium]|nr:hypothetical protein [Acidobacteriaceae bacterium]
MADKIPPQEWLASAMLQAFLAEPTRDLNTADERWAAAERTALEAWKRSGERAKALTPRSTPTVSDFSIG